MRMRPVEIIEELASYRAEPSTPYEIAVSWLQQCFGLRFITVHPDDPEGAVLVAEAVNWAAKMNPAFYALKPAVFDYAAEQSGVASGWGEDGCFYLYHPKVGVVSAHDPGGEIASGGVWPYPYHGVHRQSYAFQQLEDPECLAYFREATSPASNGHRLEQ